VGAYEVDSFIDEKVDTCGIAHDAKILSSPLYKLRKEKN
jgi:hypothetical protein